MTLSEKDSSEIINTRFSSRLKRAVLREAAERRVSLRAILEAAVRDRYDPERSATEKQLVIRELKTLRREVLQVGAGNTLVFEALALLVKNLFSSLTPPTAEARLIGDQFYARFIDAVIAAIENDDALMDRVLSLAVVRHDATPQGSMPEETPDE
ncbi:MAG: hypothetical protein J0I77_22240 [Rudaea sp.]|uniref:hypothetical protein n=1 Tax=unclassified Rudaea TaxID=2627037 RepID=UPI0010F99A0F|nr:MULTISPECIES: hypothetical protein [unclassified Rudaea]MBN8888449.1 hypothetical protein [Rudaea sp.]MBR0347516.1 hypothetical protein [Rudaea sp.]